ncbi:MULTISPECIES: immunity protein YezG family protein [unclassified Pedobacter]|uniref:immunity protein YezG family protein n=1 Tax=Pedobacter TaxID=84567 RepID=UPI000B4ACE81|nr:MULTISPECIES: immunity protein YezG family protein [unclassified Pedobacter]MCX2429262.1 DUF600 family protein [Pedobacter sp. GR22-10]MCX2583693.1 DUF600 family protein [Pedobacter sp. MR22-3]OWK71089.1 hypothetical protein CBW18_08400 [Pedobacter sp. AJM]
MDITNNLINEIIQISNSNIPSDDWDNFTLNIYAINKMISVKSFYEKNGEIISFDPEENGEDVTLKIKKLREELYKLSPNKGAWYTCIITVTSDGKFNIDFDYDEKPEFKYDPSPDKFIDDLKVFPRDKDLVPEWLNDILLKN